MEVNERTLDDLLKSSKCNREEVHSFLSKFISRYDLEIESFRLHEGRYAGVLKNEERSMRVELKIKPHIGESMKTMLKVEYRSGDLDKVNWDVVEYITKKMSCQWGRDKPKNTLFFWQAFGQAEQYEKIFNDFVSKLGAAHTVYERYKERISDNSIIDEEIAKLEEENDTDRNC